MGSSIMGHDARRIKVIPNSKDDQNKAPALKCYMNMGSMTDLPEWSQAPRGDEAQVYAALKKAGYQGLQGGDPKLARDAGLENAGGGRVDHPDDALRCAENGASSGAVCTTLHVGTGMEDDLYAGALMEAIIQASEKTGHPLYIETHRATVTQDIWRTVQWASGILKSDSTETFPIGTPAWKWSTAILTRNLTFWPWSLIEPDSSTAASETLETSRWILAMAKT